METEDINKEFVEISNKYVNEVLSKRLSDVWDNVSVFIYGSVSYGMADSFSNANLEVIYPDNELTDTASYFAQEGGREIKVDFSPWSKYEGYIAKPPQNAEYTYWVIQKAIILHDPIGKFQQIQKKVNEYFPDNVWKDKIFGKWFDVSFNGIRKALERNENIAVQIYKGKMIQSMLELTFLLNRQYVPPVKWLHKMFLELPILSKEIEPHLKKIIDITRPDEMEKENKVIRSIIGTYIKENALLTTEKTEQPWMYV